MKRAKLVALIVIGVCAMAPSASVAVETQPGRAGTVEGQAPDFELPAVQLRIGLNRILAEHAFLIIEAMRTASDGGEEFEVAAGALEDNTAELLAMVEAAYGVEGADAFSEQWNNHHAYLLDYARAVADGDEDARDLAESQLETYIDDFSEFLVAANPGLPPDVVEGLIDEHIQQLEQIGSLGEAEFSEAYPGIRETYAHMFMIGDGLALGVVDRFGDRFEGRETAFSPALDLRLTLDRLLGEHTYLAAHAMRAQLTDAGDLDAAAAALGENSDALADQIGSIYGEAAGNAFDTLWRSHIGYYLAYVEGAAGDDAEAQEEAQAGLREYRSDFGAFLAGANPLLDAAQLEALLETHTDQLVSQVSDYRDEDFAAAYGTLREAYAHTEMLAAGLGGAIADQFPSKFPDTAMATQAMGRETTIPILR